MSQTANDHVDLRRAALALVVLAFLLAGLGAAVLISFTSAGDSTVSGPIAPDETTAYGLFGLVCLIGIVVTLVRRQRLEERSTRRHSAQLAVLVLLSAAPVAALYALAEALHASSLAVALVLVGLAATNGAILLLATRD
jgi:hypothetical protein